ncbi:glycosyltransferase family protein [Streptomyces sp. CA-181903]|uniref:glycosyltransferase family protein n=1 Tax=Streptomyces sp. CA-181903 TaxID=3240055 RepID=UPI003D8F0435
MAGARVLMAGNFHWQAGFSQTVAAYVEAAGEAGCEVRVSGPLSRMDDQIPRHLPVEPDVRWGTHLVFMFEARQYLSDEQVELACSIPRDRRLIIDFDGHWGGVATAGDSSVGTHAVEDWQRLYSTLGDLVLQPKTGPLPDGAEFFPCFGMPGLVRHPLELGRERDYDLQYIGSNWGRWEPFVEVVEAARRARLRRIRVCGRWWDDETCPGFEDITSGEPERLAGVEVAPPVPFGHVVAEMGRAAITPVLVSPLVADTGLLTARAFETLASGSLPVLPAEAEFMSPLYGGGAEPLMLGADPAAALGRLAGDFERHAELVGRIQERARARYNYPRLLAELLAFFR